MILLKSNHEKKCVGEIKITGSKSETNRLLILKELFKKISLSNISNSDDSNVMRKALNSDESIIDIGHAGTAMRFLTSFYAISDGREIVLTGSERMRERPIKILVDALNELGANIKYTGNKGYPPLKIKGKNISGGEIILPSNISSQYLTSLLLIGPRLKNGLKIKLSGQITSYPYVKLTLEFLKRIGVDLEIKRDFIFVKNITDIKEKNIKIESDWSSASYFFSAVALSRFSNLKLSFFSTDSLQGDSILVKLYKKLGVVSKIKNGNLLLSKNSKFQKPNFINLNLNDTPDLAQTIAVTCLGLKINCELNGLHTLKIKETDRLLALKNEISKFGASVKITNDSLHLIAKKNLKHDVEIDTYNDHRMAMAFAPLALKNNLKIKNEQVVTKSYPAFWKDLQSIGFQVIKI
ncbi:MAG: 3-phosphoshikimate 1-carboxyvinyltransferase [Bacteroidota bacterium]|nr:3-phosphoshikimate 1-carboxyvinyltransferase [Bacteroidota bacterium]MEC8616047.1 3-phosphoshikimate 1-carboxyvinyltransferase [Bacteroidota bacterium]